MQHAYKHACIHAQLHHVHMHMHKHTTHACLHMHLQLFSTISSFVDVSFVDSIQPMVCIPCLHMHLQSLCSTSVGVNAQMQCKCMCMHFTHKAHMICTCMYLWIVYNPWCFTKSACASAVFHTTSSFVCLSFVDCI